MLGQICSFLWRVVLSPCFCSVLFFLQTTWQPRFEMRVIFGNIAGSQSIVNLGVTTPRNFQSSIRVILPIGDNIANASCGGFLWFLMSAHPNWKHFLFRMKPLIYQHGVKNWCLFYLSFLSTINMTLVDNILLYSIHDAWHPTWSLQDY